MKTLLRTTILYPLIWDEGDLQINVNDQLFDVHFKRTYLEGSSNVEISFDRLGSVASTSLEILFPTVETDNSAQLKTVQRLINRLIEVYRFTTNEFFLDSIPLNELRSFDVFTINDDGTQAPDIVHRESFGYGLTIARTSPIPDEARQHLQDATELPISSILLLNARRELLLENYRIGVIEAETAFEAKVDETISRHYQAQKLSSSQIKNILSAGLKNLIKDHVPRACGESFIGSPEHSSWQSQLYDLRNIIVHDGASATLELTTNAIDAAQNAIAWLSARVAK